MAYYEQPPTPPYGVAPHQPQARPSSPWWRRTWVIAAVACLIGIGIGGASASSSSKKHDAATEPAATVAATVTASPAPAPQARTVTLKPTVIKTVATRVRIKRVVYTPPPPREYGDGTYVVGVDILPGTYHADPGQGYCAWIT